MLAMKIGFSEPRRSRLLFLRVDIFFVVLFFFVIIAAIARATVVLFIERNDLVISLLIMYLIIYKTIISRKCSDLFTAKQRRFMFLLVNVYLGLTLVQLF